MKLTLLFAKYLYQHKQLNLPGIGEFSIDPSVATPEQGDKNAHEFLQHIRFTQKNIARPDEEFINFIRTLTGKIRPLAESDLESFLSEGKILLNIGKPFHLEGIGTLQKSRAGNFEFHPGMPLLERIENFIPEKELKASVTKQPYENEYGSSSANSSSGRMAWIVIAILVGLGAIIWGGYSLYNKNTNDEGNQATVTSTLPDNFEDTTKKIQSDSTAVIRDSNLNRNTTTVIPGNFKFIFRLSRNKDYVIARYNDLKPTHPNLDWDYKDSLLYRLYLTLPATPPDTARIRDSLQRWYGAKRVIVEK